MMMKTMVEGQALLVRCFVQIFSFASGKCDEFYGAHGETIHTPTVNWPKVAGNYRVEENGSESRREMYQPKPILT